MRWRRFALDGGVLKKRGGWRWEGSLKKPDVIRSPRNKTQKKIGSPSAVGVFGTPHRQVQGTPEGNFLEGYEGCDAACDRAWSSRIEGIPRKLPHAIECDQSMGCSRELTERNWKSNRRSCIVNTYICIHTVRSISMLYQGQQSHEIFCRCCHCEWSLYGSPSIWKTLGSSSADAYHVMTSVFEVGGIRVDASQFI